eukprot:972039-Prymnesium_polylepis.1
MPPHALTPGSLSSSGVFGGAEGVCRGWVVGVVIACSAADRRWLTNIGVVSQPRPGKLPKHFEVGGLKMRLRNVPRPRGRRQLVVGVGCPVDGTGRLPISPLNDAYL